MKRPWMPLYVGDFLADTMHLNCQETGAYLRLLMHAWQHDALIPDNDEALARIVRCHPPHWKRLRTVIEPFFDLTKTPGSWYSKRVALELTKSGEISNKRKAAALQKHSNSSANVVQLHTQSQPQSQPQLKLLPERKEDSPADAGSSKYVFEDGIIRLNQRDFNNWEAAYKNLDLAAELMSLSQWAEGQGPKWFHAVKAALAKRNREARARQELPQNGMVYGDDYA